MRISDWSSDVCSSDLGFRAHVEENAEHRRHLRTLGRREDRLRLSTPWGMAQSSEIYADGVVFHSTASHGGIKLDRARNAAMPAVLRVAGRRACDDLQRTARLRGGKEWGMTGRAGVYAYTIKQK